MSDVAVQQVPGVYEPSLFGTYSKKIGMWLFLLSDSLTFGALLYAYTYGRISTPRLADAVPFRKHPQRDVHDCVPAHQFADHGVRGAVGGHGKPESAAPVAVRHHGLRSGIRVLHGREWTNLIAEGLTLPVFPIPPGEAGNPEFVNVTKTVPQFAATFFGLTGMHMLHVTLGVVYLGVVALRKWFIPVLLGSMAGGMAGHARL